MAKKEQGVNIDDAIHEGIEAIVHDHPRFKDNEDYILRHVDKRRLREGVTHIQKGIHEEERRRKRQFSDEERTSFLYHGLANHVASGGAFDDVGKEVILRKGLEEKARKGWFGAPARRILEGEKYLDNVLDAFRNLYALLKSGDYAQRMPEVAQAVATVYDMGFLDSAVDVLGHYGLIDNRKYQMLKHSIVEKAKTGAKEVEKGVEKYSQHKAAAIIFGISGVALVLISGTGITGAVIGGIKGNIIGALSRAFLLGVSALLFFAHASKANL